MMKKILLATLLLFTLFGCASTNDDEKETYIITATVKFQTGEIIKVNAKSVKYFNSYVRIIADDGLTYYVHPSNCTVVREVE